MRQAEDVLKQGKLPDAGRLLDTLEANPYLTTAERQKLGELQRQMQTLSATLGQQGKADAKSLLSAGRAALQKGDLSTAETLANHAEKVSSGLPAWCNGGTIRPPSSAAISKRPGRNNSPPLSPGPTPIHPGSPA